MHEQRYGHATPGAPCQLVTVRTTGHGAVVRAPESATAPTEGAHTVSTVVRDVVFDGTAQPTTVIDRARLPVGTELAGPAIVLEDTATTVVPPDAVLRVDQTGFLIITLPARPELETS
jgi:N-methylhydantoinase A